MKKLKYLFLIMLATFMSVSSVNAEVKYQATSYKLLNRNLQNFPFTTRYAVGENTTYSGNYVEFLANTTDISTPDDLPKYVYTIYCGTAKLNLESIDDSSNKGSISNQGSVIGGTCEVIHNGNYYQGNYYLNRWLVNNYNYYSSGEMGTSYGIKWAIRIHNTVGYNIFVRFESMFVSNEMINDFSSDYLLSTLISQNSSLRSELNEVKSNTSETNNKLDETNEELGKVNDNITNDDVSGVENSFESFESFISENSTITQLITMPITLYSSILNGLQSTCQPFNLGNLFGTSLTMPCINIGNYLGSTLWSMIDIIISGFAIFSISKKFIKIFNNFSSMKEGDVIDD